MSTSTTTTTTTTISDFTKNDFLYKTQQLQNYNEIYGLNQYLEKNTNMVYDETASLNNSIKTKILNMKYDVLFQDNNYKRYQWRQEFIVMLMFFISVSFFIFTFFLSGRISKNIMIVALSVLWIIALIIIFFKIAAARVRNMNSYDQVYWSKPITKEAKDKTT